MKKHLVIVLFSVACLNLAAQDGVRFTTETWTETLAAARKENKLIFLDAFTTWCGPCRMMTQDVFPERAAGDFFNRNFINVSMDMEAGEGRELAQQYHIEVYPTLLFVDGEGHIVHRAAGFHNAVRLIELGRVALDTTRRLSAFANRYAGGERNPEFLHDYAMAALQAMDGSHLNLANEYLRTQDDWSNPKNMRFIFTVVRDADSNLFEYIAAHREAFEEMFGTQAVINRVQNLIMEKAFEEDSGPEALEKVDALFAKTYPEVAEQLSGLFRMNYYQDAGDIENYTRSTVRYMDRFPPDDAADLNNAAWNFFQLVDDRESLLEAVKWAERSVELDGQYYNFDTLASLYEKVGQKKKALRAARQAIELARVSGEDYSSTQELLDRLKGN